MNNKFKISEYTVAVYKERIINEIKRRAETMGIEPSDYLEMLLEKDTAKKPKDLLADLFINWECPNCNSTNMSDRFPDYCSYCGQRIDWSEYDEKDN